MHCFDMCLAWNWEYDADFVALVHESCRSRNLSLLQITRENIESTTQAVVEGRVAFRMFVDRATDVDPRLMPLVEYACRQRIICVNPFHLARRSWNKALMHHLLIDADLPVPRTVVLPSYEEYPDLSCVDVAHLGDRFTIKPAHGGGGDGVINEATTLEQALAARLEFPADNYLLQARIVPLALDGRPAWFRPIYCLGHVYASWWDPLTHIYQPVSPEEEHRHGLSALRDMMLGIAAVCELPLFSTEIALVTDGRFVVVDYVNDLIDLRLQSRALDGVPDYIVHDIAARLAELVATRRPAPYPGW